MPAAMNEDLHICSEEGNIASEACVSIRARVIEMIFLASLTLFSDEVEARTVIVLSESKHWLGCRRGIENDPIQCALNL